MTNLNIIVAKAAFLYERMQPPFLPDESSGNPELVRRRLENWRQNIAKGEQELFESRLAQDHLTVTSVQAVTAGAKMAESATLPEWANCLAGIIQHAAALSALSIEDLETQFPFLQVAEPPAFQHLMVPFVEYASATLKKSRPDQVSFISSSAFVDLQSGLIHSLCTVARDTLYLEFSIWRSCNLFARIQQEAASEPDGDSRTLYGSFIGNMWTDGLSQLAHKYPVLGRMLAQIAQLWISSTGEFLDRLRSDHKELGLAFSRNTSLGACVRIRTGLSDRHNGGRTVLGVEFENGTSVIYKNKNPESQQPLDNFFQWLMENTPILPLYICKAVYRAEYYWIEQVRHEPCQSMDEVRRYYRRAGALACIMYLLGGYDFHADNLIACGEYPVIIDTETILHPELRLTGNSSTEELHDSVLRVCMFPRRGRLQQKKDYNCGLAHKETTTRASSRLVWQHINTDRMRLVKQEIFNPASLNLVSLNDRVIPAEDGLDDILAGFRETYQALLEVNDRIFEPNGPLACTVGLRPRFVFRNTAAYEQVLRDAWQPQYLCDGIEASLRFDALSRALLKHPLNLRFWPLLISEHAALGAGDIPMFFHSAETGALILGENNFLELENAGEYSGFMMMRRRFRNMSLAECEKEVGAIVESFNPE